MSPQKVLVLFGVLGLVLGASLLAGCLGTEEQPGGRVSATPPPTTDSGGVSGGTIPQGHQTTVPIPIPIGS
jgi:hypothetical protein